MATTQTLYERWGIGDAELLLTSAALREMLPGRDGERLLNVLVAQWDLDSAMLASDDVLLTYDPRAKYDRRYHARVDWGFDGGHYCWHPDQRSWVEVD